MFRSQRLSWDMNAVEGTSPNLKTVVVVLSEKMVGVISVCINLMLLHWIMTQLQEQDLRNF